MSSKSTGTMIGMAVAAIAAYYAYTHWSAWFPATAAAPPVPLPPATGIPVPPSITTAAPVTITPAPIATPPVPTLPPPMPAVGCPMGVNPATGRCYTGFDVLPSGQLAGINMIPAYLINGGGY